MAAVRASEKAAQDLIAAANIAAPLIVAGVEDDMAEADMYDEQNDIQPVPAKITRVFRPHPGTDTSYTFADFNKGVELDYSDVDRAHELEGLSSVVFIRSFLNTTWSVDKSTHAGGDTDAGNFDNASEDYQTEIDTLAANITEVQQARKKKKEVTRGKARAVITSKRGIGASRSQTDDNQDHDVVMESATSKRKRALQ
jgi:hypothetical protein